MSGRQTKRNRSISIQARREQADFARLVELRLREVAVREAMRTLRRRAALRSAGLLVAVLAALGLLVWPWLVTR